MAEPLAAGQAYPATPPRESAAGAVAALAIEGLVRTYKQGSAKITVLDGVDLSIDPGEIVALVGPSGSGKSTLLHAAGLLERPQAGSIRVRGRECARLSDAERTAIRRETIGFVYQAHHLLPEFSALENVVMPQLIAGGSRRAMRERAGALLEGVGLKDRVRHRPAELSGGEQQRVALARALANDPHLLLADEPTGNLDEETAEHVFALLLDLARSEGVAALIATHNMELAHRMDRILTLSDHKVHSAPG